MVNPVLDTRTYALVSGFGVGTVGVLGIVLILVGQRDLLGADFLAFDWTHNVLHLVLAMVGTYVGFDLAPRYCNLYAKTFGGTYLALGALGFVWPGISATVFHLELGENLVHLALGAWGLAAGFLGTTERRGLGQKADAAGASR